MFRFFKFFFFSALVLLVPFSQADDKVFSQRPVFNGATGFGTNTLAGRHGILCKVTSLADNGPGTLRDCVDRDVPRTVIFKVAGTIELQKTLVIENPFISILGHSAPGDGVMITTESYVSSSVISIATHDVLIQFVRIRAGASDRVNCCRDALSIGNPEPGNVYNVVIDRNSISWGTDEVVEIWYDSHDITFSYNIISEGLHRSTNSEGPAGRGFLVGGDAHSVSIHHNLFAHNYQRNPMVNSVGVVDVVNNLAYHWVSRGASVAALTGDSKVNFVGNKFIERQPGPGVIQPSSIAFGDISVSSENGYTPSIYLKDNIGAGRPNNELPEWSLMSTGHNEVYDPDKGWTSSIRHPAPVVPVVSTDKLEAHLISFAGAYLPRRDTVDKRIISELFSRTGVMPDCVEGCEYNAGGWPTYSN